MQSEDNMEPRPKPEQVKVRGRSQPEVGADIRPDSLNVGFG